MSTMKQCKQCQRLFTVKTPVQQFCSTKCSHDYMRRNRIELTCQECGKPFRVPLSSSMQKYCSRECFHKAHARYMKEYPSLGQKQIIKVCEQCGNKFEIHAHRVKRGEGRFCSRDCTNAWKRTIRGKEHPLYRRVLKPCDWCGEMFECKRSTVHWRRFCSKQCQGSWTVHNQDRECTSIEIATAQMLDSLNVDYEQQFKIGRYLCDFTLPEHKLVIECDGIYWHSSAKQQATDKRKNEYLMDQGYTVLRLSGDTIRESPTQCKEAILNLLKFNDRLKSEPASTIYV